MFLLDSYDDYKNDWAPTNYKLFKHELLLEPYLSKLAEYESM